MHQWLVEMLRRFNLMFSIYDEARLAQDKHDEDDFIDEYDAVENPFHAEQLVLCSLEFLTANAQHARMHATASGICWWWMKPITCNGRRRNPATNTG